MIEPRKQMLQKEVIYIKQPSQHIRTNPNTKPNTFPKKPARQKWTGPIYLPGHIYELLSQEAKHTLQKYNVEAIQKFKTSRNLYETDLIHDVYEHTQEKLPPSIDEEEFQECQEFNTDKRFGATYR